MDSAIKASALTRHFGPEIKAVDGIDLDIPPGQIFGFLGQNGSGKTTTVRMFTTLLRPTSGTATVAGFDVVADQGKVRESIGVALQEAGLDDIQTGRELLTLQARLFGIGASESRTRAGELLEVVGLADAADRRIGGYSGGMKRRLDLAAALVDNPPILFLDEPTTGLDPVSRESIWAYVRELNTTRGITVFLTTQYMEEADRLCDEIAIMDAGKIVASGKPAELKASIGRDVVTVGIEDDTRLEEAKQLLAQLDASADVREVGGRLVVYLSDGAQAVPRIVVLLSDAGLRVEEVTLAQPTLDDVFLRITGHHIEGTDLVGGAL